MKNKLFNFLIISIFSLIVNSNVFAAPVYLQSGDIGQGVRMLKGALEAIGIDLKTKYGISSTDPDANVFGPKTEQAIRDFQKINGIKVDGLVGEQTISKIEEIASKQDDARQQLVILNRMEQEKQLRLQQQQQEQQQKQQQQKDPEQTDISKLLGPLSGLGGGGKDTGTGGTKGDRDTGGNTGGNSSDGGNDKSGTRSPIKPDNTDTTDKSYKTDKTEPAPEKDQSQTFERTIAKNPDGNQDQDQDQDQRFSRLPGMTQEDVDKSIEKFGASLDDKNLSEAQMDSILKDVVKNCQSGDPGCFQSVLETHINPIKETSDDPKTQEAIDNYNNSFRKLDEANRELEKNPTDENLISKQAEAQKAMDDATVEMDKQNGFPVEGAPASGSSNDFIDGNNSFFEPVVQAAKDLSGYVEKALENFSDGFFSKTGNELDLVDTYVKVGNAYRVAGNQVVDGQSSAPDSREKPSYPGNSESEDTLYNQSNYDLGDVGKYFVDGVKNMVNNLVNPLPISLDKLADTLPQSPASSGGDIFTRFYDKIKDTLSPSPNAEAKPAGQPAGGGSGGGEGGGQQSPGEAKPASEAANSLAERFAGEAKQQSGNESPSANPVDSTEATENPETYEGYCSDEGQCTKRDVQAVNLKSTVPGATVPINYICAGGNCPTQGAKTVTPPGEMAPVTGGKLVKELEQQKDGSYKPKPGTKEIKDLYADPKAKWVK